MADIQVFPSCVALLADLVRSREGDRRESHAIVLDAIEETNANVPQLDALRVTIGDELQGVYATLGDALAASFRLRGLLWGAVDIRFGLGGGDVSVVDEARGIQEGSAWIRAREAINAVEAKSREPGFAGLRTAIRDGRDAASPLAEPLAHLVDVHIASLSDDTRGSLAALLEGLSNQDAARRLRITPSANSQRVNTNDLRTLVASIRALEQLP